MPVCDLFAEWLDATDEFLVCRQIYKPRDKIGQEECLQVPVSSVRSGWNTMREHLGIPFGWGPKLLRHSMATILANMGVNMIELEIALGHHPLKKTTDRYVIFSPDYLKTVLAGIEDVVRELHRKVPHALIPPPRRRLRLGLTPWIRPWLCGTLAAQPTRWSPPGIPISARRHQYLH
jgi:hypothetical protein